MPGGIEISYELIFKIIMLYFIANNSIKYTWYAWFVLSGRFEIRPCHHAEFRMVTTPPCTLYNFKSCRPDKQLTTMYMSKSNMTNVKSTFLSHTIPKFNAMLITFSFLKNEIVRFRIVHRQHSLLWLNIFLKER